MFVAEKRGEIQWQRAVINTMDILRKAGITETEASLAASIIQVHPTVHRLNYFLLTEGFFPFPRQLTVNIIRGKISNVKVRCEHFTGFR